MNPYDWKRNQPQVEVPRSEVASLAEELRAGGSAVLMAGRGLGKSVFLGQVERALEGFDDTPVVLIDEPPAELTVASCLETLARRLGVSAPTALSAREVIEAYRARDDAAEHLVLLYDELDHYAGGPHPPGGSFFNSLEFTRRNIPRLGIMARSASSPSATSSDRAFWRGPTRSGSARSTTTPSWLWPLPSKSAAHRWPNRPATRSS